MLPTFITIFTYNITNSANHTSFLGYTNFQTRDNSVNAPWLWPFVLGECWHNNHHARAGNYSFKQKWWEFDPAGAFIKIFKNGEK
jgi:stearoyl-CoA desaturase (delta-9 desaturase)